LEKAAFYKVDVREVKGKVLKTMQIVKKA